MLFTLDDDFIEEYEDLPEPFGFGELGRITFVRTYTRTDNPRLNGQRERWVDVCRRVTEGTFSILLEYVRDHNLEGWNPEKVSNESRSFFDLLFHLKWTPPGRGLWSMGTPFVHERGNYEALQNCGFVSTSNIDVDKGSIFAWFMSMLMVGVGVGADLKGQGLIKVSNPEGDPLLYHIPDTRQGWAESIHLLVDSYLEGSRPVRFNYDLIRPRGAPIRGYGGLAEGPEILASLHESIRRVLDKNCGHAITQETLADIFNLIGKCVVAGNVRRSAEILFGDADSATFIHLKDRDWFPERNTYPEGWGAYSNNTVFARIGMDYSVLAEQTWTNGEPGYVWMYNARRFGRMDDIISPDPATGGNPCLEQMLESWELCTLAELHLPRIENKEEFMLALKAGYLYSKIVTLASEYIGDARTRKVMTKNRRIGLSCSGITQAIHMRSRGEVLDWMDHGYHATGYWDKRWSQWLGVPESIRRTSVKPSGTVSLLSGITPGIHYPIGRYYLRRMRLSAVSSLIPALITANYKVEPDVTDPTGTMVAIFPIDIGVDMPGESEVDPWSQLVLAGDVARVWADNAVSITVKFNPEDTKPQELELMLKWAEKNLKSVSFLRDSKDVYPQMPYERITKEQYEEETKSLRPVDLEAVAHEQEDEYCDGEACEITTQPQL